MFDFWKSRELSLKLDGVESAIKGCRGFRELESSFAGAVGSLRNDFSRIHACADALNATTADSKYSNIVKGKFCTRTAELLNDVSYPGSIFSSADFQENTANILSELSSLSIKEFRHLHAFKDGMKAFAGSMKSAEKSLADAGRILNYPVSESAIKAGKSINEIKALQSFIADSSMQEEVINAAIAEAEKKIEMGRIDMERLLQSSDYMRMEMIEKEMKELNRNKETIERKISEEFASIGRIFRKFAHISSYEKELVGKYMDNGFAAFLEDENGKIKIILDKMRATIDSGTISIEKNKYQKLLDILRSMSLFASLRSQHSNICVRIDEMAGEMPPVKGDIARVNGETETAERLIARLRKDLNSIIKRRDSASQSIEGLKAELALAAGGILGKKVTIQ